MTVLKYRLQRILSWPRRTLAKGCIYVANALLDFAGWLWPEIP